MKRCSTYISKELQIKTPLERLNPKQFPNAGNSVSERNLIILVRMQNFIFALEVRLVFSCTLTLSLNNCTHRYLPKLIKNLHPHKKLYVSVYSSFIHNWQKLEAAKMSFRVNEQTGTSIQCIIIQQKKKNDLSSHNKDMEES